jgi:hypothetical protein
MRIAPFHLIPAHEEADTADQNDEKTEAEERRIPDASKEPTSVRSSSA